jgi:uncharacterized NAD(P)/FAD-binding protein YdhS
VNKRRLDLNSLKHRTLCQAYLGDHLEEDDIFQSCSKQGINEQITLISRVGCDYDIKVDINKQKRLMFI